MHSCGQIQRGSPPINKYGSQAIFRASGGDTGPRGGRCAFVLLRIFCLSYILPYTIHIVTKKEILSNMAEKLKIIPLGGLNEIGKNMTVYEYGGEIIVAAWPFPAMICTASTV